MRKFEGVLVIMAAVLFSFGQVAEAAKAKASSDRVVHEVTRQALKGPHKKNAKAIANVILAESKKRGVDPLLVLAVIKSESGFNPGAVSKSGEVGLMQISPKTAAWIAKRIGVKWKGPKSLKDPSTNIRLGTAYLAYIKKNRQNPNRTLGGLESRVMSKAYVDRVRQNYVEFYNSVTARKSSGNLVAAAEAPNRATMATTLDWFKEDDFLESVMKTDAVPLDTQVAEPPSAEPVEQQASPEESPNILVPAAE